VRRQQALEDVARHLIDVLAYSDRIGGKRDPACEAQYRKAVALLRKAGFECKAPVLHPEENASDV
jgi:hypothetical protein